MWTLIKTARAIIVAATALFAGLAPTPSHAQPIEFVQICTLYGAGFFYIPGTDTCVQANQIVENQYAIARLNTRAATGTAMAASLVAPWLPTGTNFAVSNHWAGFDGQHAVGMSGLMRISATSCFRRKFLRPRSGQAALLFGAEADLIRHPVVGRVLERGPCAGARRLHVRVVTPDGAAQSPRAFTF